MKISYNWLKEYVDIPVDAPTLGERLSLIGFELEEIQERRLDYPRIVVGKILRVEPHPNADKLTICQVDIGTEQLNIVCGAPNVRSGQHVPVALEGAQLPNGMRIKKARIRGVESEGMICSEAELGLADHSEGIWVLPDETPVGEPLAEALQFEPDWLLDLGITPNRPDALCHVGIGREVAAVYQKKLRKPAIHIQETGSPIAQSFSLQIQTPQGCPRYAARIIRNVQIGPSPPWLVRRLEAVGMRSINNIVDITNYVMMELGQPLHAFDLEKLAGNKIVVRESRAGERFVTLDNKEHTLPPQTVLICDAEKPVAIGGIMGGLNSEVTQQTRHILLESAYFAPEYIQRSARALGITSEASLRFSRGTDPNGVLFALDRAAQLMAELAHGQIQTGVLDAYPRPILPWQVPLKVEQMNTLLGTRLSREEIASILEKLELHVEGDQVTIPTFRPDLTRVADLAEEVARLYGLDQIPAARVTPVPYRLPGNRRDQFVDRLKEILTGLGLTEVITNSMVNAELWQQLTGQPVYPILNPISADMSGLRNALWPSLLQVIQHNVHRQNRDLRIFEINRVFHHPGDLNQQPREELRLAIALTGSREGHLWYSTKQSVDFYDVKGIAEALADKIFLDRVEFIAYDNSALETEGLLLKAGGREIGFIGQVNQGWLDKFDVEQPVYLADLSVETLFQVEKKQRRYRPIPRFPWVDRDLALVVDRDLEAGKIIEFIQSKKIPYLKQVQIFDVYQGKQIAPEKKSVALRFIFQSEERTLREEEVNQQMEQLLKELQRQFHAQLRS